MNDDDAQAMLQRILVSAGTLEQLIAELRQQSQQAARLQRQLQQQVQEGQDTLRTAREQEAKFKQAMVALFQEQQQRVEAAMRPAIFSAWQVFAALAGVFVLLFVGMLLLLHQGYERLEIAQARADAAEVKAEVQEASQHVEITSCGSRPCIRVDKDTPTWKSESGEYILVDGRPDKQSGERR